MVNVPFGGSRLFSVNTDRFICYNTALFIQGVREEPSEDFLAFMFRIHERVKKIVKCSLVGRLRLDIPVKRKLREISKLFCKEAQMTYKKESFFRAFSTNDTSTFYTDG